jgi:ribonuclease D
MGAFEKVFLEKNDNLGYRTIILIPTKLLMFGQKPFFTIETDAQLQEITDHLQQQDIIAVDLEANSLFAFRERISLIQVSTYDNDYVIDPLSISDMEPLLWVLRNPKIRKVMHGSDFDIVSFKRDYQEHLDYARGDTHWLLALYDIMTVSLKKIDLLTASFEESELLTKKEWNGKGKSEDPYVRLKGFRGLELLDKKKVRLIWELREKIAEKRDVPSFRIFSNHSIIALANADPDSPEYSKILGHSALGKDRKRLRDCICSAEEDERIFEKRKPTPRPQSGPYTERVLSALRLWRNEKVERENIDPVIVFSNGQLKDIARAIPRNKEDLMNIDGIRKWQCQLYTLEILRLVDDALPNKAKNKTVT